MSFYFLQNENLPIEYPDSFCVRCDIQFPEGNDLPFTKELVEIKIAGFSANIKRVFDNQYVLKFYALADMGQAEKLAAQVESGLYWFSIKQAKGLKYNITASKGIQQKRLTKGNASFTVTSHTFPELLEEGIRFDNSQDILKDSKLKLALETYALSHYEPNLHSRFLLYATCLEILLPDMNRQKNELDIISEIKTQLKENFNKLDKTDTARKPIESILNDIGMLKRVSIKQRLKLYVETALKLEGHKEAERYGEMARQLYDVRSKIVHNGYIDLNGTPGQDFENLRMITELTLQASMKHLGKIKQYFASVSANT